MLSQIRSKNRRAHGVHAGEPDIDLRGLATELRGVLRGEVRFGDGDRALYASDASNYRQVPLGVVIPRDADDVVATVEACRRHGAPLLARGGGTGIPGQSVNAAVMIDFSKYMRAVVELDPARRLARVEPGCVLDDLRTAAEAHQLTFGPDPATHDRNTLGGMVANNSCGVHSVMAGRTSDNVESLEVLTYRGARMMVGRTDDAALARALQRGGEHARIYGELDAFRKRYAELIRARFPTLPRRISGYNLPALLPENGFDVARALVGSECTCALVLEVSARLVHSPQCRVLVVIGVDDINTAADRVPELLEHRPIGLEGIDHEFIEDVKKKGLVAHELELLPPGKAWLFVELGADDLEEAKAKAAKLSAAVTQGWSSSSAKVVDDRKQQHMLWRVRESGLGATARVPGQPDTHEGWEDAAVPTDQLGVYLRAFRALLERYGYQGALYGHFGDGCVHTRLTFDLVSDQGRQKFRSFLEDAADLVVAHGGSFSGEHGDGQARAELLPRMFGDEMTQAFSEFKRIWDPDWKMNPGKLVSPYRVDENLRWGIEQSAGPPTRFIFPDDRHSFAYATERCVGAGVCRHTSGGTMCPSFMVTHEEKHSTRGRARMLSEMLRGDPIDTGWHSEEVKEALDLCLSCKGCKGDCPVRVDVATYKAEFLSHYFEHRARPRSAWAMGRIHRWSRLAAHAPGLANLFTRTPGLSAIARWVAGIDPRRAVPQFAPVTFERWFRGRKSLAAGAQPVMLWPDTFNNHFHPQTAVAAVLVLEAAGFRVVIPDGDVCCGRPLYDFGWLDAAKARLLATLHSLAPALEQGIPIVMLEPSCASVFRDELGNLLPDDPRAHRLAAQTLLLSELLARKAPSFRPRLLRSALVHGHCHHKSILKIDDEEHVLAELGLELDMPDTGCCGMAGAFGFERGEHCDVAIRCGERVLLPAVRAADPRCLIIADGFSCREMIRQHSQRRALHLAEVLRMALDEGPHGTLGPYPERRTPNAHDFAP